MANGQPTATGIWGHVRKTSCRTYKCVDTAVYPADVVDRVVFTTCESLRMRHEVAAMTSEEVSMRTVVLRLPWIGHKSTGYRKEIERGITRGFNLVKPRIFFTTRKTFTIGGRIFFPSFHKAMLSMFSRVAVGARMSAEQHNA